MHYLILLITCGILWNVDQSTEVTKYSCRTGHVYIKSSNRILNIEADNYQVFSEIHPATKEVKFTGLIKSFEFRLGAIDRAYNSRNIDLGQFSKFNFSGKIVTPISFTKPGKYKIRVEGILSIGNEKRITSAQGTVQVLPNGHLDTYSDFTITIEEESMNRINQMMREKLPSVVSIDTNKLGVSRQINIVLKAKYRPRH